MPRTPPAPMGMLESQELGGVVVRRNPLERELTRMMGLCYRVGRRMTGYMRNLPATRAAMVAVRDDNGHTHCTPMLDEHGKVVMVDALPDSDFLETAEWYSKTLMGLLREQRERAKLVTKNPGLAAMTDAAIDAELLELVRTTVATMPEDELQTMLAARGAIDVPESPPQEQSGDSGVAEPVSYLDFGDEEI